LKSLLEYKFELEDFYNSPEYQKGCEILEQILQDVRGMIIALDLEGTLVSKNILEFADDPDELKKQLTLPPNKKLLYFRRPYANELLEILSRQNSIRIWTAASIGYAADILTKETSLKLPRETGVIDRFFCAKRIKHLNLIKPKRYLLGRISKIEKHILDGVGKIPSTFGVDLLIDDQAEFHRYCCMITELREDVSKILEILPFIPTDQEGFETIHEDEELLKIANQIARFHEYLGRKLQTA